MKSHCVNDQVETEWGGKVSGDDSDGSRDCEDNKRKQQFSLRHHCLGLYCGNDPAVWSNHRAAANHTIHHAGLLCGAHWLTESSKRTVGQSFSLWLISPLLLHSSLVSGLKSHPHPLGALLKLGRRHMRSRAMPGRFWDSTASKPITGTTLLLAMPPPNGLADLRDKEKHYVLFILWKLYGDMSNRRN